MDHYWLRREQEGKLRVAGHRANNQEVVCKAVVGGALAGFTRMLRCSSLPSSAHCRYPLALVPPNRLQPR